ncbi:hypothetical protein JVT61DRAFT_8685 [Boletus reticuloceps]|uniref:Uncharacterized protein n=1 Tax=Boletus reticuloceps TaxID=495285 RepID=A0A8I3ACN1_9AGAM|nr:hypothetical protein JVT61DRAFT_8685 [Boletus reticuloceps]
MHSISQITYIDYVVQVKNGGTGPNRTVERILLESPLVQAYRNAQAMIQRNFLHTHLTIKHSDSNMTKTFKGLTTRLEVHSPHMVTIGRKSHHEIIDMMDKGQELMERAIHSEVDSSNNDPIIDSVKETIGLDDVLVELL